MKYSFDKTCKEGGGDTNTSMPCIEFMTYTGAGISTSLECDKKATEDLEDSRRRDRIGIQLNKND